MTRIGSQGILGNATLIHRSEAFSQVLLAAEKMAGGDRPVMVEGESGTGKARVARIIHELSSRRKGPFRTWNAAEASATLASSDLFGVVKGAYTGAIQDAPGIIEASAGGTLVIDDVDKLVPSVQAQMLRFLDEWTIRRIGSNALKAVDVRLICTTNRNLRLVARAGGFLPDLAYRLSGLRIVIPPLRSRPEDIMPLVRDVAARAAADEDKVAPTFTSEAVSLLESDAWEGNAREVAEVVQNLVIQADTGDVIDGPTVRKALRDRDGETFSNDHELARLRSLPPKDRRSHGVIARAYLLAGANGVRASQVLGIPIRSFRRYLRQYGLTKRPGPLGGSKKGHWDSATEDPEYGTSVPR